MEAVPTSATTTSPASARASVIRMPNLFRDPTLIANVLPIMGCQLSTRVNVRTGQFFFSEKSGFEFSFAKKTESDFVGIVFLFFMKIEVKSNLKFSNSF
jgi:hypothetical protein